MPWTLNKNSVTPNVNLSNVEQGHLNDFMNAVRNGTHPKTAAASWDSDYKNLTGDQYQIRLSQANRATFLVNNTTQVVTMTAVGGHT
jgi:hypothetical protein